MSKTIVSPRLNAHFWIGRPFRLDRMHTFRTATSSQTEAEAQAEAEADLEAEAEAEPEAEAEAEAEQARLP